MLERLTMFFTAALFTTVAVGCGEPPGLTNVRSTPGMKAKVSSALSSSASKSDLGISRWHSTVLSGTDGKKAGTIDGQDSKGKVRFLATIREDKNTLHIQAILPKKGEWIWDAKKQEVVSSTIPDSSLQYATAFISDWRSTHPDEDAAATSTHAGFRAGKKIGGGGGGKVGPDDEVADAMNYWAIYFGHKYGYISDSKYDAYNDPDNYKADNYDAKGKRIDPNATTETKPPAESESPPPEQQPSPAESESPPPEQQPSPAESESPPPADDLPAESKGGNLDNVPEQSPQQEQQPEPAPEPEPSSTFGNDTGDPNPPSGGDGSEAAIVAKHTTNATPNTRCKTAATSKSTGIRACLQY